MVLIISNLKSIKTASDDDLFRLIESIASMGFIVTIPDYIGFGASANLPHPYQRT